MNIEVKQTTSKNPSQMAKNIKKGFEQVGKDGKVAVYLPNRTACNSAVDYAKEAYAEASRKGWVKGNEE